MKLVMYTLAFLLFAPVAIEAAVLVTCLISANPLHTLAFGFLPPSADPISLLLFAAGFLQFLIHLGLSVMVYLGEQWARVIMLISLFFALIGSVGDLIDQPTPFGFAGAAYCLVLGYMLIAVPKVRESLRSQELKGTNKAPEPTTMAVTPRAPSSTSRAGHGRGSS